MKNSILLVAGFACLVCASLVYGQGSFFGLRCSIWSNPVLDKFSKELYISGLRDALIFSESSIGGVEVPDMSNEVAIRAVDELCSDFANTMIPVPFIFRVISMRISGAENNIVQAEISRLRRQFSPN